MEKRKKELLSKSLTNDSLEEIEQVSETFPSAFQLEKFLPKTSQPCAFKQHNVLCTFIYCSSSIKSLLNTYRVLLGTDDYRESYKGI